MKQSVVVASALLALGLSSTAAGYQNEGRIGRETWDIDSLNTEISIWDLGYRYYFAEVDDDDVPYWLQPFKQRASWAEATWIISGEADTPIGLMDITGIDVAGRYVIPEQPVGVDVELQRVKLDDEKYYYSFTVGAVYWLTDENDFAVEGSLVLMDPAGTDDVTIINIGARYILPIEDYLLEIAGRFASGNWEDSADESGLEVETRFFFNKQVFAGISLSTVDEGSTWELSGGYSDDTGIRAELGIGKLDDDDIFRLEVGYRF